MKQIIEQYYLTKDKKLRDDIAIHFMYLAERSAKKNSSKSNYEYEELLSYAYEGLIKGIELYNKDNNKYTFLTYLYYFIETYIRRGIIDLKFDKKYYSEHILHEIEKSVQTVEFKTGKRIIEEPNLINEIMNELKKHITVNTPVLENIKNFILRYYGTTNNANDYDMIYDNIDDYICEKNLKDKVHNAVKMLNPEYQNVIKRYFDLDMKVDVFDLNAKNLTRQAIFNKKYYALKQLEKNDEIKNLRKDYK